MMKGLSIAPAPAPRPGAAAALDQYAREQLSTRLKYVFGRIDIKGDGRIDAEELAEMLVQLGCDRGHTGPYALYQAYSTARPDGDKPPQSNDWAVWAVWTVYPLFAIQSFAFENLF